MSRASAAELVKFWSKCSLSHAPFVHPDDIDLLAKSAHDAFRLAKLDYQGLVRSDDFGRFSEKRFHFSLYPVPYLGRLATADVLILALNPGCRPRDYYLEHTLPEFRDRLGLNLRQELDGIEFPFMGLDPAYSWAYTYWAKRLRHVVSEIARRRGWTHLAALEDLSRRIAVLQLVPYHSYFFGGGRSLDGLPSTAEARKFARSAAERGKTVIITRAVELWEPRELLHGDHVVRYDKAQARSASLGRESKGGKAILALY